MSDKKGFMGLAALAAAGKKILFTKHRKCSVFYHYACFDKFLFCTHTGSFVFCGKIVDGIVDTSIQCSCGVIHDSVVIFAHAIFDPVQHNAYKAVFIEICDKNFLLFRSLMP